jgi:RNA polymerase sigma-70 factor (ECF subfamily)
MAPHTPAHRATDERSAFEREIVTLIPHLRAFARSLCKNSTKADDLAQDALAKAWKSRDSFQPGTNMKAWAFMILRNQFLSENRRVWRSVQLEPEMAERTLIAVDNPEANVALDEVRRALEMIPFAQREALIMVGAGGLSYDEAAEVIGVPAGTVKSRVSRARVALQHLFDSGAFRRRAAPVQPRVRQGQGLAAEFLRPGLSPINHLAA